MELLDGFNEQWVDAASFLSNELVVALLQAAGEWSNDFYRAVGPTTVSSEFCGYFSHPEPAPYWMLSARECMERVIHQSQIRRAVDAPELAPDLVALAGLLVAHAMLRPLADYDAADGAAIGVDLGAAESWAWHSGGAADGTGWSVVAPSAAVDARIAVPPEAVVPLLTRGLHRPVEVVTIDGDADLAVGVLAVIGPLLARP